MADWLVARLAVARRTAIDLVGVANRLESLPMMARALAEGSMSFDQVRAASQLATADTDGEVTGEARGCTVAHLEGRVRLARRVNRNDDEERQRHTSLWWRWEEERGTLRFGGRLADADGAKLVAAIEREAAQIPPDPVSGMYAPFEERAAQALVALAGQRLAEDGDPDRATAVVHLDVPSGTAELENGITISTVNVEELLCDGRCQLVFTGAEGVPVGVGRATPKPPRWLERLVRRRDKHCRFPGCGRRRWTHVHHMVWWTRNGPTDLENLILLCTFHHRLVHRQNWRIEGNPGGPLEFIRADGRRLETGPPPLDPEIRQRVLIGFDDTG